MMMEELSIQLEASDPDLAKRVIIALLAFSAKLESAALAKHDLYSRKNAPLLHQYEKQVKEEGVEILYFLLHVSGNHWISACLNFRKHDISFGQYS
jgi:hypothetical protein